MKKLIPAVILILVCAAAMAQNTGGIMASILNRTDRSPIVGAEIELFSGETAVAAVKSDSEGKFVLADLPDGAYTIVVEAPGFTGIRVNVIVEKGLMRNLMFLTLNPVSTLQQKDVDSDNYTEFDLSDTGYSDSPTILYSANDVFTNIAGYGFSAIRYKNRGFDSETQDVYLAGVKLNDANTGYTPYSLWSGLNEAMRAKDTSVGMESTDFGIGGFNGVTNITAVPSSVRPGWRFSVLTNSAMYRLRLMANYASGQLDNGWSYAVNVSARLGGNDWIQGVYYRSFAIYAGVEKKFNDTHKLALFAFATPGERGAQNASTQEVYNLMGDNMYNSNWGYQNGKVRNSRVRKTFEPVVALKYDFTPSDRLKASATLLWRTGANGYTALDWYDAQDPRPDYYRNLPSYFSMEDEDYNRFNEEKAAWAREQWTSRGSYFNNYQHLNWDRLYNVNYNNPDGRSKYALEERHVDQNDINLALKAKWDINRYVTVLGGFDGRINRTENYKKINDLLGGKYYLNVDQYAERDFAANDALIQNDLDYFLANGHAQKIGVNGKYGYDYLSQIRSAGLWASARITAAQGRVIVIPAARVGYEAFWREGLVRKGLFAGLDDNGEEIYYDGMKLTKYDKYGNVITSKGKSAVSRYCSYAAKVGLEYYPAGGHRISANVGYFNDAPKFNQAFISARTRNTLVENLTPVKVFSTDLTYQFSSNGYNVRLTGYYSSIRDKSDVMSFYDDSQQTFTNFAMTGIAESHYGIEFGAKIPVFVEGLTLSAVVSWGRNIYTSNPHMIQTVDNSAEIVRDEDVPYWKSHPVFRKIEDEFGEMVYEQDMDGNYIVDHYEQHYVPSSPQLATELAINYRTRSYWFFEVNGQYFANSYLDMNPLYRTAFACRGSESDPGIIDEMASQERFKPAFLLNLSVGKSWYINRKYNFGFSLEVKNLLNDRNVKTGGYEQTRLISSTGKDRYYRFDPKYFYMCGANYMLNLYFRF